MTTPSEYIAALIGYSLPFAIIGYVAPVFFRRTVPLAILVGAIGGSALPILSGISKSSFRLDVIAFCALLGILSGIIWSLPWKKIFTSERAYQYKEGDVPRGVGQTNWQDHFSDNEKRLVKNINKLLPPVNTPSNQLQRQPYSPARMAPRKIENAPKDISGSRDRELKSPQRDDQRYGVDLNEEPTSGRTISVIALVVSILFAGAALAFFLQPYSSIEKPTETASSRVSIPKGVVAQMKPDLVVELDKSEKIDNVDHEEVLGGIAIRLASPCSKRAFSCLLIQGVLTENMEIGCSNKFIAAVEKDSGNINILVRDDCDIAGKMIKFFYYRPKTKSIEYAGIEGSLEGAEVDVDDSGAISVLMDEFSGGYKSLFRSHLGEITETEVPQDAGARDSWVCIHAYGILEHCASLKSYKDDPCSGDINLYPMTRVMNKYSSAYFFKEAEFTEACRDSCRKEAVSIGERSFSERVCNPFFPWSER